MLTPERVHIARTGRYLDSYLAQLWRISVSTVRRARRGESHRAHSTPPDRIPRDGTGRGNNRIAKAARVRRSYFRE
jgi:hypothetical protein